eukprot:626055-Prymnesium_polylepis.2
MRAGYVETEYAGRRGHVLPGTGGQHLRCTETRGSRSAYLRVPEHNPTEHTPTRRARARSYFTNSRPDATPRTRPPVRSGGSGQCPDSRLPPASARLY